MHQHIYEHFRVKTMCFEMSRASSGSFKFDLMILLNWFCISKRPMKCVKTSGLKRMIIQTIKLEISKYRIPQKHFLIVLVVTAAEWETIAASSSGKD